jgi:hypothetical protein
MRPTFYAAAIAMILGSAACVGSLDTMPLPDDEEEPPVETLGRQAFDQSVLAMVNGACASCHTGPIDSIPLRFLGSTGPSGYYAALTADVSVVGGFNPALANLLLKGEHDGGNARAWTDTEKDAIIEWILIEADERGIELDDGTPTGPTPLTPRTSREALAQWVGCMSIDDWNTSLVYQWAQKGSDRGQCQSCHNQGAGGFFANNNRTTMFEMNRFEIYVTSFFTAAPVSVTDPSQGYRVMLNEPKLRAKANAVGHPAYNPDGGNQMQYLRNFYNLTMARLEAGDCGPPGFPTELP